MTTTENLPQEVKKLAEELVLLGKPTFYKQGRLDMLSEISKAIQSGSPETVFERILEVYRNEINIK